MLLIIHFDKTVSIITTKCPPTDTWIKNLNIVSIKDNQMSCDVIKQIFAIYPYLNRKFSILWHLDDIQLPKD